MKSPWLGFLWVPISFVLAIALPASTLAQEKIFMKVVSPQLGEIKDRNECNAHSRQHLEWICLETAFREATAPGTVQASGTVASVMSRGGKEQQIGTGPYAIQKRAQPAPSGSLKVAKVPDTTSSKLQQAMNERQALQVTIEFTRTDRTTGAEETYQRLQLTGANITSIASRFECGKSVEEISLSYPRIKQEDLEGGRVVSTTCKDFTTDKPCN